MGYHGMWGWTGIFGARSYDTLTVWTRSAASVRLGSRIEAPGTEAPVG